MRIFSFKSLAFIPLLALAFIFAALTPTPASADGNCGSDQFLTCNTGNVGKLPDTTAFGVNYEWAVRTWNGNYNAVKPQALINYMMGIGFDTVNTYQVLDSALTGYASAPTDTLRCSCTDYFTQCYQVAGLSGTSNGAALTVGHLPAACRPSHTVIIGLAKVTDNGVTRYGTGSVATTGIITISKTDTAGVQSATFTTSGTKALGAGVTFGFSRF